MLQYIFIRIVKPSDTGGIIRRLADRDEFSDEKWSLAQKLASALDSQGNIASNKNARLGRILTIKGREGKIVELTHEALVRQWPMYQKWLKEASKDNLKRIHDAVIDKNKKYQQHKKSKFLLMGYELEESLKLLDDEYKGYLSESEVAFIEASNQNTKAIRFWKRLGVILLFALVVLSGALVFEADRQKNIAEDNLKVANDRLYDSLIQEGITQRDHFKDPLKAKLLFANAVQSPNNVQEKNAKILYENVMLQSNLSNIFTHNEVVYSAAFNKDEDRILSWDYNNMVLYRLYRDRKLNKKFYSLEAEVESGLRLLSSGELKALSKEEWLKKKKEYQTVLNKQVQEETEPSLFRFVSDLFD